MKTAESVQQRLRATLPLHLCVLNYSDFEELGWWTLSANINSDLIRDTQENIALHTVSFLGRLGWSVGPVIGYIDHNTYGGRPTPRVR